MGVLDKVARFLWSPPIIDTLDLEKGTSPRAFLVDDTENEYTRQHGVDYKTNRGTLEDYLQTYEVSTWVYICVSKKMASVAQVPLKVWKRKRGSRRDDWVDLTIKEPDHNLVRLLQKPNPWMTEYELKQGIIGCLELGGNTYLEVVGKTIPEELYLLLPYKVKVVPDSKKYILGYIYEILANRISFDPEDIIHLKYFHPRSQYYGLSPIQAAELSIISDLASANYNKKFFENSAIPDGFLTTDQELSDPAFRRLKKMWQQAHGGIKGAHRIAIGEMGLKWQATAFNAKDMEFINSRKLSREEITNIYGIPPAIAGIMETSSYGSLNEQKRFFWENTMAPLLSFIESKLNSELVPKFKDDDLYIEFDITTIQAIRENRESEARVASALVDRGIKTANEIRREMFGLEPVEWGDVWHPPQAGGLAVDQVVPNTGVDTGDRFADDKGSKLGPGPKGSNYTQGKQPNKFPSTDRMGKLLALSELILPDILDDWSESEGVSDVRPFQQVRSKFKPTQ